MDLDDYVRAIIANPNFQTKSELTVAHQLIQQLTIVRETSEAEIREWRAILQWPQINPHVQANNAVRGDRTGVLWPEDLTARFPRYIGTFHTHPYRKKLAVNAAVGFSIGDFVFFAEQFPPNFPLGVNMVTSGDRLFLAVYRQVTQRVIGDELKREMETDEDESENHARAVIGHQFDTRLLEMQIARQEAEQARGIDAGAEVERGFYEGIRGYTEVRVAANDRMIRNAARRLRFELYVGRCGGTLHLKSDRVHFATGIKGWHQRNMQGR